MTSEELLAQLKKIAENSSKEKKSGNAGWITSLVMFFVSLIGIFIFAYVDWKKGKELAKLRHEKSVAKVNAANSVTAAKAAKNVVESVKLQGDLKQHLEELRAAKNAEKAAEALHKKNKAAIDAIRDWSQI